MKLTVLAGCAVLLTPLAAAAQVGHAPESSPYRDVPFPRSLTLWYSDIGGNGGKLGIGPHDGPSYGARFDIRLSTPIQFSVGLAQGNVKRLIVDADDPVATRVKGPVDQTLTMIEAALQFNITGRKTWHRLAPYGTGYIGFVSSSNTPADTSGFKFGSKVYFAPGLGLRIFITNRLHLRAEARQLYWKLTYPTSYFDEPLNDPGVPPNSNAVLKGGKRTEWTGGRDLKVGLGFSF
jgi:hypothetical protein